MRMHSGARLKTLVVGLLFLLRSGVTYKNLVLMPALPTLRESGVEMDMESWYGFYAAAGTPAAVVERLSQLLLEAVRNTEVRERVAQIGIEPSGLAGAELVRLMQSDYALWSRAIKLSGIQPQ
jgi:tripartite-type tricarboxylate transporter receptor subunit TctC